MPHTQILNTNINNTYIHNKQLKIIEFNVNSLIKKNRRIQLELFMNQNKPDIVLLCETKIKPKHKLHFPGYKFIRNDRLENGGGGTGIIIRSHIKFESVNTNSNCNKLECTIIKVDLEDKQFLYIGTFYNPPKGNNTPHLDTQTLDSIFNIIDAPKNLFIFGGDLNAKHMNWFNPSNNKNGEVLQEWLNKNSHKFKTKLAHTMIPTYNTGKSYLDVFLIHKKLNINFEKNHNNLYLKTLDPGISDHKAVELIVNLKSGNSKIKICNQSQPLYWNYANTNWLKFQKTVKKYIDDSNIYDTIPANKNLSIEEINSGIDTITDIIHTSMSTCITKNMRNNSSKIDLPTYVIKLLKHKHTLQRKLFSNFVATGNKTNQEYCTIKSHLKCVTGMVTNAIEHNSNITWSARIQNIRKDQNVFKNINQVTNKKTFNEIPTLQVDYKDILPNTPLSDIRNILQTQPTPKTIQICNDIDKANMIAQYYEDVHNKNQNYGDQNHTISTENIVQCWLSSITIQNNQLKTPIIQFSNTKPSNPQTHSNQPFTSVTYITELLKALNNKKSSGYDEIPNAVLKKIPNQAVSLLCTIINNCLNISYFPDKWKIGKILPLAKPRKPPINIDSYRPICLLSCLGKIFERIILQWHRSEIDKINMMPSFQFGFRPQHSTTHALLVLSEDINKGLIQNKPTTAALLDLEKAFDNVWIYGLIWKLRFKFNIDERLCVLIFSYLRNRVYSVIVNGCNSRQYVAKAGVPQGAILSPDLYTAYTLDVPSSITVNNRVTNILQYADDTIIYSTALNLKHSEIDINQHLEQLKKYYHKWKIKINQEKCEYIIFRTPSPQCGKQILKREKNITIKIGNYKLKQKKSVKYLGVVLTNLWKNSSQLKQLIKKTNIAKSMLYPVMNVNSKVHKEIKILCYKQLIRPLITYGFPIWFNITSSQMETLRRIERRCLRQCLSLKRNQNNFKYTRNSTLYADTNIVRIDKFMFTQYEKFMEQLPHVNNEKINRIYNFATNTSNNTYYTNCIKSKRYLPPSGLNYYKNKGIIYGVNDELIFYHRRYNENLNNIHTTIYDTQT